MDEETALIIVIHRRRRALNRKLLIELGAALAAQQPTRTVRAKGQREIGLARFQRYRRVPTSHKFD